MNSTNVTNAMILEERRKHEEEVESMLNDHYDDLVRVNKLLEFVYH